MRHRTKSSYIISLCFCFVGILLSSCRSGSSASPETKACFERIVNLLDNKQQFRDNLDSELANLKGKAASGITPDAQYYYNKLVSEKYESFVTDSALFYLDKNFALAEKNGREDWRTEMNIAKAKICSMCGMFVEAREALDEAKRSQAVKDFLPDYYMQEIHYHSQSSIYQIVPMADEIAEYADSLKMVAPSEESPYYTWACFWAENEDSKKAELRDFLIDRVKKISPDDSWYSPLCFYIGVLSTEQGKVDDAVHYFTENLAIDISHVSRNLVAMTYLSEFARHLGELSYAIRFMRVQMQLQSDFQERVHSGQLSEPFMRVFDDTVEHLNDEAHNQFVYSLCISALAIFALIALLFAIRLGRKRHKLSLLLQEKNRALDAMVQQLSEKQEALSQSNKSLSESQAQLAVANAELADANFLKEEYIGNLFALCSENIDKMRALKKKIGRQLKVRKYEELAKLIESSDLDASNEMGEFNALFDEIFLSIFPDFVEQLNSLLRPEEQLNIDTKKGLNTDIRIYALVRLGINNSVKIAKILGVSPQTVYNSRMKMRGRATISEEEFPKRVRQLCGNKQITDTGIDISTEI